MDTHMIDGKRLVFQQTSKKSTTPRPVNESSSKISSNAVSPPPPEPSSTDSLIARREVTPKTRIVIVRTGGTQNEQGETADKNESPRSKSVDLPPVLTNGRTSVYLIRRPIPPAEPLRTTHLFQSTEDLKQTEVTTTTTDNNLQNIHSPTPTIDIVTSPSQIISSPTQSGNSQPTISRSRSKSRARGLVRSTSKHRSRSATRRISPNHHSPSSPPSTQEQPKDGDRKRNFFSFSKTKNTAVQANLFSSKRIENEDGTVRNIQPSFKRKIPRTKSAKSILLINPADQTIAVIENSYLKGEPVKRVITRPKSSKKNRFQRDIDSDSTDKFVKTSRWYRCLGCLSRHMCLIIIICFILVLIGLAGVGVSAYFLATNSQTNNIPMIVGIAVGGALAIAALFFLYCILACIGSRDGYFSYNDDGPHIGGRAFALIPSTHPNAHHYIPRDYTELYEKNQSSSLNAISTIPTIQQQTIHRQKTIVTEINNTTNAKNVTIEMPERLLTAGRKISPKSHERKLNKVVNNIGHVVEDAKKRYNVDGPTKVIVKVDENAKATV